MLAVILAAGRGARLTPITDEVPKALVEVEPGLTLLELAVRSLRAAGVEELVVVAGYRARKIEEALSGLENVEVVRNPEYWRENGFSLLKAREAVGGREFVLVMADHVFEPELVHRAVRAGPLSLCVDREGRYLLDPGEATKVRLGPGGLIRAIGKRLRTYDGYDTGVFACDERIFWAAEELVKRSFSVSVSDCVGFLVSQGLPFKAADATGLIWADVDTHEALKHVREHVLPKLMDKLGGVP